MSQHHLVPQCIAALLAIGLLTPPLAFAQVKRTPVLTADVSTPGHEAVVVRGEIAPGANAPRHTHPGDEISYVTDGEVALLIDGEPPRVIKAGEAFVIPAGKVHGARNDSGAPVRFVGVYVVEKGRPLATPAR